MTIKEVCEQFSLTPDTLRYYERAGVIPQVSRTPGGQRYYSEEDISWVNNAVCMRNAGMSVEAIAEYVRLYRQGDGTLAQRRDLLCRERNRLRERMAELEGAMRLLDYKISRYEAAIETGVLSWDDPPEETNGGEA